MKKIFLILVVIFFTACVPSENEEIVYQYNVTIKNISNQNLNLIGYNKNNEEVFLNLLIPFTSYGDCNYRSIKFTGFECIDKLVFEFENSKGYICKKRTETSLCFSDKSPFKEIDFNNISYNTYEFIVNQEDFENALDIP